MADKSRRQQLEEMLREDPHDPFLRYGLAMDHVSAGDDGGAVGHFQDLIAADPTYVPAYMQAGQALLRLDRVSEAQQMWQKGVAVARQQGDTHAAEEMAGMAANLEP
jgi:Tfp pilus assembly protein PilF